MRQLDKILKKLNVYFVTSIHKRAKSSWIKNEGLINLFARNYQHPSTSNFAERKCNSICIHILCMYNVYVILSRSPCILLLYRGERNLRPRGFRFISRVAISGCVTRNFSRLFILLLQPSWMRSREYWDDSFEARFAELRKDPTRPPLKVS